VLEDRVEQRLQIARRGVGVAGDVAEAARAVQDLEFEVVLLGGQGKEEIVDFGFDFHRPGVGAVDLVDQDDRPLAALERLLQDEARLGQRPLRGVHEQEHPFDHRQDPLDLGAEIPVARRVDDVDDHVLVMDRGVLGEDRDPPLFLELARVHDELVHVLADAERAALIEQGVDESRLAVIDVRHDGDRTPVGAAVELGGQVAGCHENRGAYTESGGLVTRLLRR